MRPSTFPSLVAAVSLAVAVQGIQQVSRGGRYLYTADGSRFYIKGIAYQEQGTIIASASNAFLEPSSYIDPLANGTACSRDLPYLQELGVNTIRAYSVDSSLNHDDCMKAFSNAGIYTIIDLSLPVNGSINRDDPQWTTSLLDQYIATIDAFSAYDNVLAYNVGNEVVIATNGTGAAAYVKAAARDIKAYLTSKKSSALVGYAAIDADEEFRNTLADYLSCDATDSNSGATAIDLYGLNNYEWCGVSTFAEAYSATETAFANYNIPAYFSEFGCITSPPRVWTEVAALFSSEMTPVWSGGLAFSYFPAESAQGQFGIVNISSDGTTVTTGSDFDDLKTEYNKASPPNSPSQTSAGTTQYPACPVANDEFDASTTLPPTPNLAACNCLESTLSCIFTPVTSNYTSLLGELFGSACGLLGAEGGTCDDIAGNGTSGVYGRVASCDPTVQLSFVFSEYYSSQNRNPQACSFAGNATINSKAPTSVSEANVAASSCIASPTATFVPTAPAGSSGSSGSGGSGGSGSSGKSAAIAVRQQDGNVLIGIVSVVSIALISSAWTLF